MNPIFDAFWRAWAYCLRPRVILMSMLPFLPMLLGAFLLDSFWLSAVGAVHQLLESTQLLKSAWGWLEQAGMGSLKSVLANVLLLFGVTPLIIITSMLLVTVLMTPMIVGLVARRRFPNLVAANEAGFFRGLAWALASVAMALVAIVVTLPLWLIPMVVLILPPLIWGWLTYRVMAFDALATHATVAERKQLFHEHRYRLLAMGVFCGYLGGLPSLLLTSSAMLVAAFVIFLPFAVWIYILIFVFSSLWFAHYCLAALEAMRGRNAAAALVVDVAAVELPAPADEVPMRQLLEP